MLVVGGVSKPREMLVAGLAGAAGTAIDIAMLVLMVGRLHLPVPLAAFLSAVAGAAICFAVNKRAAFRDRTPVTLPQVVRFSLVAVATALLTAFAMKLVAVELGCPYVVAKVLCAAAVFVAWTYPAQRRLVFRAAPAL